MRRTGPIFTNASDGPAGRPGVTRLTARAILFQRVAGRPCGGQIRRWWGPVGGNIRTRVHRGCCLRCHIKIGSCVSCGFRGGAEIFGNGGDGFGRWRREGSRRGDWRLRLGVIPICATNEDQEQSRSPKFSDRRRRIRLQGTLPPASGRSINRASVLGGTSGPPASGRDGSNLGPVDGGGVPKSSGTGATAFLGGGVNMPPGVVGGGGWVSPPPAQPPTVKTRAKAPNAQD